MKHFLIFFVSMSILFAASVLAEPSAIQIRSRYLNPATQKWDNEIVWSLIRQAPRQYGAFRNNQPQPDLVLHYSDSGRLMRTDDKLSGMYSREIGIDETITLSWGYPFPFDDLNPGDSLQTETVSHKRVGDTHFAYHLSKEIRSITPAEALAQGMVRREQSHAYQDRALKLIVVQHGKSTRVRQLWAEGDSWWLYEDTENRKSWRETH